MISSMRRFHLPIANLWAIAEQRCWNCSLRAFSLLIDFALSFDRVGPWLALELTISYLNRRPLGGDKSIGIIEVQEQEADTVLRLHLPNVVRFPRRIRAVEFIVLNILERREFLFDKETLISQETPHIEALAFAALRYLKSSNDYASRLTREIIELCHLEPSPAEREVLLKDWPQSFKSGTYPVGMDFLIGHLIAVLISEKPQLSWPLFREAILNGSASFRARLQFFLGDPPSLRSMDSLSSPIFRIGVPALLQWCDNEPSVAPAFLGGIVPLLNEDAGGLHPLVMTLIEKWGVDPNVSRALAANIQSRHLGLSDKQYWDKGAYSQTYLRLQSALKPLLSNSQAYIRNFAQNQLDFIGETLEDSRRREEERELGVFDESDD
jgi:hypothetical protein